MSGPRQHGSVSTLYFHPSTPVCICSYSSAPFTCSLTCTGACTACCTCSTMLHCPVGPGQPFSTSTVWSIRSWPRELLTLSQIASHSSYDFRRRMSNGYTGACVVKQMLRANLHQKQYYDVVSCWGRAWQWGVGGNTAAALQSPID